MKPETVDVTAETEVISAPVPVNEDKVDALIRAASKIDELGKALDKFRTFVLQRALPGDFVSFKAQDSDEETLELIGAATDRIAAALGISFVDWRDYKESGTDEKGPWYDWYYECTTTWQGRRIERTTGRAGSRDKFFGMAHGQPKNLADVKESDIRTAARRNCMKEGVKLMLGLRRIPKSSAQAMGLDVSKVKAVNFGSGKGAAKAPDKGKATTVSSIEPKKMRRKADGAEYMKYIIKFANGGEASTIKADLAEACRIAMEQKELVIPVTEETKFGADLKAINSAENMADEPKD